MAKKEEEKEGGKFGMGRNKLPSAEIRTTQLQLYIQSHRPFVSGNNYSKRRARIFFFLGWQEKKWAFKESYCVTRSYAKTNDCFFPSFFLSFVDFFEIFC